MMRLVLIGVLFENQTSKNPRRLTMLAPYLVPGKAQVTCASDHNDVYLV